MTQEPKLSPDQPAEEVCPVTWLTDLATIPWDTATAAACLQAAVFFLNGIGFWSLALWHESAQDGMMAWDGASLALSMANDDPLVAYLNLSTSGAGDEVLFLAPDRPASSTTVLESRLRDRSGLCAVRLTASNRAAFIIVALPAGRQTAGAALLSLMASQCRIALGTAAATGETRALSQALAVTQARILELANSTLSDQTVNAVAHQLNNCLTSVLGYSQLLLESGFHSPQETGYLKRVFTEAERMSHIVGNMLNFARRRTGGPELVDVNELLHESIALQTYELEKHNVAISLDLDPDLPLTIADPYKMQIIFLNVLMNAHQAIMSSAEKGRIVVRTARSGVGQGPFIRIEFEDDGPGILADMQEAIFRPFFTTRDPQRHAGLGLAVCRSLAQEHHGRIELGCSSGRGATVCIEIPVTGP
jgi:signal transduction histidine kinase